MLLIPVFLAAISVGDAETAGEVADQILTIAIAVDEPDLLAFGRLSAAQAALVAGDIPRSMRMFDEVMVSVTMGDVSPIPAGIIYCAVVDGCVEACDLRRAAEWTEALRRWCDDQPDLVPYRGQCMVHRSQVLLAQGSWADAALKPNRPASDWPTRCTPRSASPTTSGGAAPAARRARRGRRGVPRGEPVRARPVPGFALLRLAEGDVDGASARLGGCSTSTSRIGAIRAPRGRDRGAAGGQRHRRRGELVDELTSLADATGSEMLVASADHGRGTVLLASGEAAAAIAALRAACKAWRELHMPYEAAQARFQLGLAYGAAGDRDAADLELDGARATFESLGASVDLARIDAVAPAESGVLTERECQVLRLVAAGKTNREIAADLVISEHTVSRHLQNMFLKLGVTSRAGATAYAYEHHLV